MGRDPRLAWRMLETLGARVRELAGRLEGVVAGSVPARLADWVLRRARPGAPSFDLGMTQEALAAELGTVREVVARTLADLVRSGLLERAGRARYRVVDARGLRRLAGRPESETSGGESVPMPP